MENKTTLEDILDRLRSAQKELEQELDIVLAQNREKFHYNLERGKVVFEKGIRKLQLQKRTRLWRYLLRAPIAHALTAPVIYSVILPLAMLDITVTAYQHICFRAYKIPRVRRADYMLIDRHHLAYLNGIEKLNCMYCSYANGLIEYVREIAARTEQFWCPIKHAQRTPDPHARTDNFYYYGDAEAWHAYHEKLRQEWS